MWEDYNDEALKAQDMGSSPNPSGADMDAEDLFGGSPAQVSRYLATKQKASAGRGTALAHDAVLTDALDKVFHSSLQPSSKVSVARPPMSDSERSKLYDYMMQLDEFEGSLILHEPESTDVGDADDVQKLLNRLAASSEAEAMVDVVADMEANPDDAPEVTPDDAMPR